MKNDSETLRRAVSLMRGRAEAHLTNAREHPEETGGPLATYSPAFIEGAFRKHAPVDPPYTEACEQSWETAGEHYAAVHPAVALAVADLLDLAATHEKREGDECGQGYTAKGYGYIDPSCSSCGTADEYAEPWPCDYATTALAVARAYLGESV